MSEDIQRFVIPNNGPETESILHALAHYVEYCQHSTSVLDALLIVPTKQQLEGTVIDEVIGIGCAKQLLKGKPVDVQGGGSLLLKTERTFRGAWHGEVLIVIYPTKKMLNAVDACLTISAVVVVPWIMEEISEWVRSWSPSLLGDVQSGVTPLNINAVVQEGLKALTSRVNLSTGLAHPSDRSAAIGLFRILQKAGEALDADEIRAWAMRNNWIPRGADDLCEVVQGVLARKRFKTSRSGGWATNILDILRERAAGDAQ